MAKRRGFLGILTAATLAGCSMPESPSTGENSVDSSPSEETPIKTTSQGTPACSASDVLRPPVLSDSDPSGTEYPDRPSSFSRAAVHDFLTEFETAYARNKTIRDTSVTSVNVVVQSGFDVDSVDRGFLAHGNVQVMYNKDAREQTATGDRKYRANYFISDSVVLRVETTGEDIDPRDESGARIVACFE